MTASSSPNCVRSVDTMNQEKVSSTNLSKNDVEIRSSRLPLQETRSLILGLSALVGELCSLFLQVVPLDSSSKESNNKVATPEIAQCMAQLVKVLLKTSASLDIHLETAIWKKMELNNKKYPVELCKGKAGKYTNYSSATGITKEEGQSTVHLTPSTETTCKDTSVSPRNVLFVDVLPELTTEIRRFAQARQWSRFHLPRNLALALLGELGELAELVQWNSDTSQSLSVSQLDKLGQELADVSIYLIRLADVCGVELAMEYKKQGIDDDTSAVTPTKPRPQDAKKE